MVYTKPNRNRHFRLYRFAVVFLLTFLFNSVLAMAWTVDSTPFTYRGSVGLTQYFKVLNNATDTDIDGNGIPERFYAADTSNITNAEYFIYFNNGLDAVLRAENSTASASACWVQTAPAERSGCSSPGGLVAFWPLDSSTTFEGISGLNGTIYNVSTNQSGRYGKSYLINQTSLMSLTNNTALNVDSFGIIFSVRPNSSFANESILLQKPGEYVVYLENNRLGVDIGVNRKTYRFLSSGNFTLGAWTDVAVSYSNSTGVVNITLNGTSQTVTYLDGSINGSIDDSFGNLNVSQAGGWKKTGGIVMPRRNVSSENRTAWNGIALGTPSHYFDNATNKHYIYYGTEQFKSSDYRWGVSVAQSDTVDGQYTNVNDSLLLEDVSDFNTWNGYHLLGGNVIENPEYNPNATDPLNLTSNITVEMQLYMTYRVNVSSIFPRIVSRGNYFALFDTDGDVYSRIVSNGTEQGSNAFFKPRVGSAVYFAFSYNSSSGTLLNILESDESGSAHAWTTNITAGSKIDSTNMSELTLLNQLDHNIGTSNFTLLSLRIRNASLNSTAMQSQYSQRDFAVTSDSVLVYNFNDTGAVITDLSGNKLHGRLNMKSNSNVTRTTLNGNIGIRANNVTSFSSVYWRPRYRYLMSLEGSTDKSRVGIAYSNNLTSGWYQYPNPILEATQFNSVVSTPDPEIHYWDNKYHIIYGKNDVNYSWVLAYKQSDDILLLQNATELILVKGSQYENGSSTDYDYTNAGVGSIVNESFGSKNFTILYQGYGNANRNQIGLAESELVNGTYTKIGQQLTAGPEIYDRFNTENGNLFRFNGTWYIIYESRSEDANLAHFSEVSMAKYTQEHFSGGVDNIQVYNRSLSSGEMTTGITTENLPVGSATTITASLVRSSGGSGGSAGTWTIVTINVTDQNFTISPSRFDISGSPGEKIKSQILLVEKNLTDNAEFECVNGDYAIDFCKDVEFGIMGSGGEIPFYITLPENEGVYPNAFLIKIRIFGNEKTASATVNISPLPEKPDEVPTQGTETPNYTIALVVVSIFIAAATAIAVILKRRSKRKINPAEGFS